MIIGISGKKQHGKDTVANIIEYLTNRYKRHGQILDSYEEFLTHSKGYVNFPDIYQPHWQIKRFADKLKDIVCLLIGCTRKQLEDNAFKETELGEEWRVWYWHWYKVATTDNPDGRIGDIFNSQEEAEIATQVGFKTLDVFPAAIIKSKLLSPRLLLQLLGTDCGRKIIHPNVWVNATMTNYKPTNDCQQHSDGLFYTDEHGENEVVPVYPNWIITDVRFPNEVKAIKDKGGIVIRINRENIPVTDYHESEIALDNYMEFDYVLKNNGSIEDIITYIKNILQNLKII